jgi:hypothetical protein
VKVTLDLEQRQNPLFTLAVPVHIASAGGVVVERAELRARAARFAWTVPGPVDSVSLDPEGWLLRRLEPGIPPAIAIERVFPDPVPAAGARVTFRLGTAGHLAAVLYDLRGRKAAAWDLGQRDPTAEQSMDTWVWDGKDAAGRRLPAGVYVLVLESAGVRASRRVTLVH